MRKTKGNDQAPKPVLGNSKFIHGKTSVDNAGGQGPDPVKTKKGK
jgi:hypothetical protein